MIDQARIGRNLMINPAQIRRNLNAMDTDDGEQAHLYMYMLEMHARAVKSTKTIQSPQESYVYVLLDPRKPGCFDYGEFHFEFEPFYAGMGHGSRWKNHLECKEGGTEKNILIWGIILSGSPYAVKFVYESEDSTAVREREIEVISTIGIASRDEGPLLNANG